MTETPPAYWCGPQPYDAAAREFDAAYGPKKATARHAARVAGNVLASQHARRADPESIAALWAWRLFIRRSYVGVGFTEKEAEDDLLPVEIRSGETPCLGCGRSVRQPKTGRPAKWCMRKACRRSCRNGRAPVSAVPAVETLDLFRTSDT